MSAATPITYPGGTTVRFYARDITLLTALDVSDAITSGEATVAFAIKDLDGTTISSGAGVAVSDDWHWDANVPATTGTYQIVATVTAGAVVWKGRDRFNTVAF
jgi:hypothetical protein